MNKEKERMYHHDAFDISHAHVGKIPNESPYQEMVAHGVTGRFMKKRGLM